MKFLSDLGDAVTIVLLTFLQFSTLIFGIAVFVSGFFN